MHLIMMQLASALQLLHEKGRAHRDIKLENVLYFSRAFGQPQVKLTDFGISISKSVDKTSTKLGKMAYASEGYHSPELEAYLV